MIVRFKKELPDAKMPYKKHDSDFCYDMYAATDAMPVYDDDGNLMPNVWKYDTGISIEIVHEKIGIEKEIRVNGKERKIKGTFDLNDISAIPDLDARARSSIYKTGLVLCNAVGTVDEPYRGHIMVYFYHVVPSLPKYKKGDRIIQVKLGFTLPIEWIETEEEWSETSRGDNGFGSTGKS
jgi:hypothetical protein